MKEGKTKIFMKNKKKINLFCIYNKKKKNN